MALKSNIIYNKVTREKITWIETSHDTNGERLTFLFEVAPGGKLPVTHYHPEQTESFNVTTGVFQVKLPDGIHTVNAGERLVIPKGIPHKWWNKSGSNSAKMMVTFEPALNTETFLEQFYGLSNDGKTKPDGTPAFLQLMVWVNKYQVFIMGPPFFIQKLMGYILGGVARLFGFKNYYPQYSR